MHRWWFSRLGTRFGSSTSIIDDQTLKISDQNIVTIVSDYHEIAECLWTMYVRCLHLFIGSNWSKNDGKIITKSKTLKINQFDFILLKTKKLETISSDVYYFEFMEVPPLQNDIFSQFLFSAAIFCDISNRNQIGWGVINSMFKLFVLFIVCLFQMPIVTTGYKRYRY